DRVEIPVRPRAQAGEPASISPVSVPEGVAGLIDEWESDLRARGCRQKTIKGMRSTLQSFASSIAPRALETATRTDIVEYLAADGLMPSSRRTYRTTLSTFYSWLTLTGNIPANPAQHLPRPRIPYWEPNPLSTEQIQRL